jgi:hypothetical protein
MGHMSESPLERFIEALNTDDALRQRVIEAERTAAENIEQSAAALTSLATDAGYDLGDWKMRPDDEKPTPRDDEKTMGNTCCFVVTSTI